MRHVLIDPTLKSGPSSHFSLDWWQASPDGTRVVYGLSRDGSEDSVLHVLNVADGRDLPESIPDTENAEPHWLDDGSGFFYNQLTGKNDTPERYLDSQARFHRLGTDPAADPILMKRGLDAQVTFERIQMPHIVDLRGRALRAAGARRRAQRDAPVHRAARRGARGTRALDHPSRTSTTRSRMSPSTARRSTCSPTAVHRAAACSGRACSSPRSRTPRRSCRRSSG